MSDGISIDTSQLHSLAADLGRIPGRVEPQVEAVMKRGAENIKQGMADAFKARPHFKQIARTVSYDRKGTLGSVGYEIGPTIGGAGSLAGIAVDGGADGGGGTVDIDHVLADEAPNLERELGKILDDLL